MNQTDLNIIAASLAERLVTPRWLRLRQAVQYSGMGKTALLDLLRSGDVAGYQRNDRGDWVVDRKSIDQYHLSNIGSDQKFVDELLEDFV